GDGTRLASCGRAGEIKLWDPTAVTLRRSQSTASGEAGAISMLPNGKEFLTAATYANQRWRLDAGSAEFTYDRSVADYAPASTPRTQPQRIDDYAISRDGKLLADTAGQTIKIMDVESGRSLHEIRMPCNCLCLAFSPDNRTIYAAGRETKDKNHEEVLVYAY